jgi:phenylpropionate dioxygenase-like ring-hydroxylating dioxygenase large terminal subunit
MRREHEIEVLRRVAASGRRHVGLFAASSHVQPASTYSDPARFDEERRVLFRDGPVFAGLSAECPRPGDHLTGEFGGIPVVIVRQPNGVLRGFVNACRHRAAPLVAGRGSATRLVCGYHSWTYDLDGRLTGRPLSDGAFDDLTVDCNLLPVVVAEDHGLIFIRPSGDQPIDVDAYLAGAAPDLAALHLDQCVLVEQRRTEWAMNWKLLLDTFGEAYHIRTLHRNSIAPAFDSGCTIFEPYGPHLVNIGFRKALDDELTKPEADQRLLPYATMQYFLLPNGLVVYQLDHIEVWRVEPVDVRRCRATTSILALEAPVDARTERYLRKNLELLLDVTGREDFPLMERIQRNLDSGAVPDVVFGRIEPALAHFHASLDRALAEGGLETGRAGAGRAGRPTAVPAEASSAHPGDTVH